MALTVKLLPYQILAEKVTSYADVSLTISNTAKNNAGVEVSRLEIVTAGDNKVLMSSTSQKLKLPDKIFLKPGESKVLEYRLESKSQLYQRGKDAIARIHYRPDAQTERVVESNPETAAFMIP